MAFHQCVFAHGVSDCSILASLDENPFHMLGTESSPHASQQSFRNMYISGWFFFTCSCILCQLKSCQYYLGSFFASFGGFCPGMTSGKLSWYILTNWQGTLALWCGFFCLRITQQSAQLCMTHSPLTLCVTKGLSHYCQL